jgi:hypothetical protein
VTPPWNPRDEHERAALCAWFVEQLDARDIEQVERDVASFLKWFATLPSRREAEKRAKWPQPVELNQDGAIRQLRAAADKAQWRAGDPEPLRRHYPELADVIPDEPPPGRGQYRAPAQQKRGDRRRRREEAANDVRYLGGLWNHRGRWKGAQGARRLAIEVVAERYRLTDDEVEDSLRRGRCAGR